jgi:hypothetical protein
MKKPLKEKAIKKSHGKKKKLGYILGSILIILGPLSGIGFIYAGYVIGGSCPMCSHPAIISLLFSGWICPILGIIIIGYTFYKTRKEKINSK